MTNGNLLARNSPLSSSLSIAAPVRSVSAPKVSSQTFSRTSSERPGDTIRVWNVSAFETWNGNSPDSSSLRMLRDGSSKISLRQTTSISSGLSMIAREISAARNGAVYTGGIDGGKPISISAERICVL